MSSRTVVVCALSCLMCLEVGAIGAGCTSGTTPDCANHACSEAYDAGGATDTSSNHDTGEPDDGQSDADASDALEEEAAPVDSGPVPCHEVFAEDTGMECTYEVMATCGGAFKAGSCPSKSLLGCCETLTGSVVTQAECFYKGDLAEASTDDANCTAAGNTWVTTSP